MTQVAPALRTELVRLRPIEHGDLPFFRRWYADPDVRRWLHHSDRPDATLAGFQERYAPETARPEFSWTISAADQRPIGLCRLEGIDSNHLRAELAIVIGAKACWSRGCGTDAISLVLRHAFGELGLRRVWLITDADNLRGQRCFQKCGFVAEALLRGHRLRYGQPLDMIAMGVLRGEWTQLGLEGGG